jgi:hypothetical protein
MVLTMLVLTVSLLMVPTALALTVSLLTVLTTSVQAA